MKKKIVVIGGGIVGCLSAIRLKQAGFEVTIIDQAEIGTEASWAAAGILFPLLPWDYEDLIYRLCKDSLNIYQMLSEILVKKLGCDPELKKSGMLVKQNINQKIAIEWATKNQFKIEEKKIYNNTYFYFPDVYQIRPSKLMNALKKLIIDLKIDIIENLKLMPIKSKNKKIINWLNNENRPICADFYVLASGAWTGLIHQDYAEKIYPVRGQMIQFKKSDIELPHIIFSDNSYLLQRSDGVIIAGSTRENVGFSRTINLEAIGELENKAHDLLPDLKKVDIESHWTGFRPGSNNNLPFIRKDHFYENLFINSGHYRYGLTMAPESANILTKLIMQESS